MARLVFTEENHEYEVDGQIVPSVSEICRFISREIYSDAPQFQLEQAADRGTRIHKITESLDRYGDAEADDDILPYIEAFIQFRHDHDVNWELIEKPMYNQKDGYCGTVDRYGGVDGHKAIVDIKSSSQIQKVAVAAQLTLYKMMAEGNGFPVSKLYVLHLTKDKGYKLKEIEPDYDLANAVLTLHRRLEKKHKRKKGDNGES